MWPCWLLNTVVQAIKTTQENRVWGIVGGIHQKHRDTRGWDQVIGEISQLNFVPGGLGLCLSHCTGIEAVGYLQNKFGDSLSVKSINVGDEVEF